tara:strand:+ start:64 stop:696 length:633 start_codon:yes stop_codon:yes gene_type:complete
MAKSIREKNIAPITPVTIDMFKVEYYFRQKVAHLLEINSEHFKTFTTYQKWWIVTRLARAIYNDILVGEKTYLPFISLEAQRVIKVLKLITDDHVLRAQHIIEMSYHPLFRDKYWNDVNALYELIQWATLCIPVLKTENSKLRAGLVTKEGIKTIVTKTDDLYNEIKLVKTVSGSMLREDFRPTDYIPEHIADDIRQYENLSEKDLNWWM